MRIFLIFGMHDAISETPPPLPGLATLLAIVRCRRTKWLRILCLLKSRPPMSKFPLILAVLLALTGCASDMSRAQRTCAGAPYEQYSLCVSQQLQAIDTNRTIGMMRLSAIADTYAQIPQGPMYYRPQMQTTSCRWVGSAVMCNSF